MSLIKRFHDDNQLEFICNSLVHQDTMPQEEEISIQPKLAVVKFVTDADIEYTCVLSKSWYLSLSIRGIAKFNR